MRILLASDESWEEPEECKSQITIFRVIQLFWQV